MALFAVRAQLSVGMHFCMLCVCKTATMKPERLLMQCTFEFAGSGSAFTAFADNFHSNMLLTVRDSVLGTQRLLIDCGSDARLSLPRIGIHNVTDITAVYISHLHADHIGGLEWLALQSKYGPVPHRPRLLTSQYLVKPLWEQSLAGGLCFSDDGVVDMSYYFDVEPIAGQPCETDGKFTFAGIDFAVIPVPHVGYGNPLMCSYGLFFAVAGVKVYLTTDSKFDPDLGSRWYAQQADLIFHDCETGPKTGVHSHFSTLCELPAALKKKMWLYHYNPGPLPSATEHGFLGYVKPGQCFDFQQLSASQR